MRFAHGPPQFGSLPPVVKTLLLLNGVGYLAVVLAPSAILETLALVPARVTGELCLWQLLTYSFFHGGFFHLLFNMFALWMFGREIETRMGSVSFLKYYFLTALGASLTQVAFMPNSTSPSIGASGSIYGLLAAFAVLFPEAVIYLYFLIPLKAPQMVFLFGAIEFLCGLSGSASRLANLTHLGGLVTGFLYFKFTPWSEGLREAVTKPFRSGPGKGGRGGKETSAAGDERRELARQVDRILEKVLREGVGSLTPEEQEIMRRYSQRRDR